MIVPPAVGQRIRAVHFAVSAVGFTDPVTGLVTDSSGAVLTVDDNVTVPPGTEGTVTLSDRHGNVHVRWDNGAALGILPGADQWEVLPEEV